MVALKSADEAGWMWIDLPTVRALTKAIRFCSKRRRSFIQADLSPRTIGGILEVVVRWFSAAGGGGLPVGGGGGLLGGGGVLGGGVVPETGEERLLLRFGVGEEAEEEGREGGSCAVGTEVGDGLPERCLLACCRVRLLTTRVNLGLAASPAAASRSISISDSVSDTGDGGGEGGLAVEELDKMVSSASWRTGGRVTFSVADAIGRIVVDRAVKHASARPVPGWVTGRRNNDLTLLVRTSYASAQTRTNTSISSSRVGSGRTSCGVLSVVDCPLRMLGVE